MKKPINEKLSTAATIAVAALINSRISGLKDEVKALKKTVKADASTVKNSAAKKDVTALEKTITDLTKKIQTQTKDSGKKFEKEQLDQIRKMIRKEVGRILFDIYKLRNTWTTS